MKSTFGSFATVILTLGLLVVVALGWGMNIAAVIGTVHDPFTAVFVLRVLGIFFFPIGAIFGWFL